MNTQDMTDKIINAGKVILNPLHTLDEVIKASVDLTNVIAGASYIIGKKLAEVSLREVMSGKPDNVIKTTWKNETIEERRILSIAKGYKSTLKKIEYNLLK